jgi:hypothetical protein
MALPIRPRFSDFKKATSLQGNMETVGLNPNEANASDRNARFTLDDLRKFVLTGLPTSPGKWTTQPTVTVTVTDGTASVSVSAGTADFNGVTVTYSAFTQSNVSLPATGLQRLDAVAAKEDGTYAYVSGTSSQNPVTPAIPTGSLLANYLLYNEAGATTSEPTTTISVVDAVTDGNLNAVTSNAVFDELQGYLPLANPNGNTVALDAADGYFAFNPEFVELYKNFLSGTATGIMGFGHIPGNWQPAGTGSLLSNLMQAQLYMSRNGHQASVTAFVTQDGKVGTRLVAKASGTEGHYLDFMSDGKIYINGTAFTGGGGSGATTFTALTDTPNTYTANKWLKVNASGNAIEQVDAPTGVTVDSYPHSIATGEGTEASPYTHADNTAGIQTSINALAAGRGGVVRLKAARHNIATPISITSESITISGARGFNNNALGESEGLKGTKLRAVSGNVLNIGNTGLKLTALTIENLYLYGNSKAAGYGVNVSHRTDNLNLSRLNIQNFARGVYIAGGMDAGHFSDLSILWNGYGIYIDNVVNTHLFNRYESCVIADNNLNGVYQKSTNDYEKLTNSDIVRNSISGGVDAAGIYWAGAKGVISGNNIVDNGLDIYNAPGTNRAAADGLILAGNGNTVTGNQIEGHTLAAGIRIRGNSNVITGNTFQNNLKDIVIEAGATDNHLTLAKGVTVTDNGTRTIINNFSKNAGDPDTAGQWAGVAKPDGLTIVDTNTGNAYLYTSFVTGGRYVVATGGSTTTSPENANATSYLGRLSTAGVTVTSQMQTAINNFFAGLDSNALYDKLHCFWLPVWGAAAGNALNGKGNTAFDMAFSGAWTHSALGIKGNKTTSFANTKFTPSVSASASDFSMGIYSRTNNTPTNDPYVDMGVINGIAETYIYIKNPTGFGTINMLDNATPNSQSGVTASDGFFVNTRNATTKSRYRNGTLLSSYTAGTGTLNTSPVYIGAFNNAGAAAGYTDREYSFAYIGKHLTASEISTLNSLVETLLKAKGAGVQP